MRIKIALLYLFVTYLAVLSSGLRVFYFDTPGGAWAGISADKPHLCILYVWRGDDQGFTWNGDC